MFETAELGMKMSGEEFRAKEPALRTTLLELQDALRKSPLSVIIVVAGVEGAGKGSVVSRLNEWLDSRGIRTTAFWEETDEQARRPRYWRYWRAMPERGGIGIMFGSWYSRPILERTRQRIDAAAFDKQLREIWQFEHMLAADGVVLVKLWFHMPKSQVERSLRQDMRTRRIKPRIAPYTERFTREFDRFLSASETAIRATDNGLAPWHIIEATDPQHRDYSAGVAVLDTLRNALGRTRKRKAGGRPHSTAAHGTTITVLDKVDLAPRMTEATYKRELDKWQQRLDELAWQLHASKRSAVLVFEGWDAAGKGSTIRRLTQAIDARLYQVISIGKPTDEEAAHHYLWRFWRHLPMSGYCSIYDRSWYGRVLVERVEKLTPAVDWQRAYGEINLFERQLDDHGVVVLKFWLHVSQEEQLRRFRAREETPWKRHKITEEDWRNRNQWDQYRQAVHDMVEHTSTAIAPWHLIAAEDKKCGRIEVLKIVCRELKKALGS